MLKRRSIVFAAAVGVFALLVAGASGAPVRALSFAPSGAVAGWIGAVADFNGDGKPDLAVVNGGRIDVLRGAGAGKFEVAGGPSIKAGEFPVGMATGDFNGDGKVDLAVARGSQENSNGGFIGSDSVLVLLGNGAGDFTPAPGSPVKDSGGRDIAAVDVNGDGKTDLAVGNGKVTDILLGDGSGRFAPAPRSPIAGGLRGVADFNGDGKPDLVVTGEDEKKISILLGDGAGGFRAAPGSPITIGDYPFSVAIGDFDRDGRADLALGREARTQILLGDGAGGFHEAPGSPLKRGAESLAVGDFNGDHSPDLAVANFNRESFSVLFGNGEGGFGRPINFPFHVSFVAVADVSGDGKLDLVGSGTLLVQTEASAPAVVSGRAPSGQADRTFSTQGAIPELAADGNRVAVATSIKGSCFRIVVWTAPGPKSTSFAPQVACVDELALGGGQIAWTEIGGGNLTELDVYVAKLSGGKPRQIDSAEFDMSGNGDYAGQLLGGGSVLAYNHWLVCDLELNPDARCPPLDLDPATGFANERLVRLAGGRGTVVKRGPGSYLAAVGGGRMAVASVGAITVLRPNGTHIATARVSALPPRAVALSKTRLAVQESLTLDLYNPVTGARTKSLALGAATAMQLAGVSAKLALFRSPEHVVLVRLSDGKLISLPLQGAIDPSLTDAGLFYAYNRSKATMKGRIVFEPTDKLLARF